MSKKILTVLSVAVAVIAIVGAYRFPRVRQTLGSIAGPDVYSYLNVHGAFTQGGGVTTVTPTSNAVTLTNAQMVQSDVITFAASSTMPALTVTLPATSTLPLSREAGSQRSWVLQNPFTGAATTTTIAAGTGIDLQEPDGQNVVIGTTNFAWVTCTRKANTDVVCLVTESVPAD